MPRKQSNSPIVPIAAILSVLLALGVGYYLIETGGRESGEMFAFRSPVSERDPAPAEQPVEEPEEEPEPTPTPQPEETPEPTPTETPTPTPTPTETPTPTPEPTPERTRLIGEVLTHDGRPVPRAQLYLIAKTEDRLPVAVQNAFTSEEAHSIIQAGAEGSFEFLLPPGRPYIAGLMIKGEPQSIAQEIVAGEAGETIRLTLNQPRPFEVRGLVADDRMERLRDIPVKVTWRPTSLRTRETEWQEKTVRTGADGRFEVQLHEPAEIRIVPDTEELPSPYLYGKEPLQLSRSDFERTRVTRVDLQVTRGVTFSGRVLAGGEERRPVEGAEVVLSELLGPQETRSPHQHTTESGEDGRFRFERIFPSEYQLTASHPGYNTGHVRDFTPTSESQPEIVLHPFAEVVGTAILPEGAAHDEELHGTAVIVDRYRGWREDFAVSAGGSGDFHVGNLRPGVYRLLLLAEAPDGREYFQEMPLRIEAGNNPDLGTVVLSELFEVEGRFVAPPGFGDSFRDIVLNARELDRDPRAFPVPEDFAPWQRQPLAAISETGQFSIEHVVAGREYAILAENRQNGEVLGSALLSGDDAAEGKSVELGLQGTGAVTGTVMNDRDEACADVLVEVITGLGRVEGPAVPRQRWKTRTDFRGQFRLENLPAGQARLILQGDDAAGRLINVPRGGELALELTCRTFLLVNLEVIAPEDRPLSADEQFLVIARSGDAARRPVQEIYGSDMEVQLEPGRYTLTRTSTMESRHFEVAPRSPGRIRVDFTRPGG